jgi:hypothetical protein
METRRVSRALPPFERKATGLGFSPPPSFRFEATRVVPDVGQLPCWSAGRAAGFLFLNFLFRASLSFFWRRRQTLMMRHSSFSSLLVFAISACHLVSAVQPTIAWKYKTGGTMKVTKAYA